MVPVQLLSVPLSCFFPRLRSIKYWSNVAVFEHSGCGGSEGGMPRDLLMWSSLSGVGSLPMGSIWIPKWFLLIPGFSADNLTSRVISYFLKKRSRSKYDSIFAKIACNKKGCYCSRGPGSEERSHVCSPSPTVFSHLTLSGEPLALIQMVQFEAGHGRCILFTNKQISQQGLRYTG